jgi:4-diphosphocytidyl-2-C-methyl-D-erythritol kinase
VRGRGERVAELPDGPPLWFVIVKPDVSVSTAAAYSALDAVPARQSARSTGAMQGLLETGDAGRVIARMTNDFEQVVIPDHLPVALLCDDLMMARASNVRLCGSGSAVFGVVETCEDAEAVAARMRRKYQGVHVCRALTRAEALNTEEWGTGRQ